MGVQLDNFNPVQNLTLTATTTAATGVITQNLNSSLNPSPLMSVRIANSGTSVAFINWGGTGVVATSTTGVAVLPGATSVFGMGNQCQGVSAIVAAGSANVYVSAGNGS